MYSLDVTMQMEATRLETEVETLDKVMKSVNNTIKPVSFSAEKIIEHAEKFANDDTFMKSGSNQRPNIYHTTPKMEQGCNCTIS